jgi:hypothetical protein
VVFGAAAPSLLDARRVQRTFLEARPLNVDQNDRMFGVLHRQSRQFQVEDPYRTAPLRAVRRKVPSRTLGRVLESEIHSAEPRRHVDLARDVRDPLRRPRRNAPSHDEKGAEQGPEAAHEPALSEDLNNGKVRREAESGNG